MISVTISAQILTTPLILFYFKQFPLLFLFTNLVAVPLSGWILLGELLLCICHPFNFISRKLGTAFGKCNSDAQCVCAENGINSIFGYT